MDHPIFISYARNSARSYARALHQRLGGRSFLDTADISPGEELPTRLLDALLGAKVLVAFVDDVYFTRRYCVQEYTVALGAFRATIGCPRSEEDERDALDPIVIALPVTGIRPEELDRLPPLLRNTTWPRANETEVLAALSTRQAERLTRTIGERLGALSVLEEVVRGMRAAVEIPYPRNMAGLRCYPLELPPSLGRDLVDRGNELWEVHTSLTTERVDTRAAALSAVLEGGGGSGKTRLAIEYVHRYGPDTFPGGLFWVDADVPPDRLEQQLVKILEVLSGETIDLVAFRGAGRDARAELAQALHGQPADQPILYVVDNVPEPERGRSPEDLATWCPAVGKVALLVTSRARQALTGGIRSVAVNVLPVGPAVSLLAQGLADRSALDDGDWQRIVEWVGCLPLALVLLNAALRAHAIAPNELIALTAEERPAAELDRQMEALKGSVKPGDLRGVAEAFGTSYQLLPPRARRAARLLAQLGPEPIPISLLEPLGQDVAEPGTRAELVRRSFVSAVPGAEVPMFGRMHRVLADYLRSLAPDDALDMDRVCRALIHSFGSAEEMEDPQTWPRTGALLPHAQWLFRRMSRSSGDMPIDAETIVLLGMQIGVMLSVRGLANSAQPVEETVVQLAFQRLGPEHPATLNAMNNLAATLRARGDYAEARRLQERVLEASQRTFGDEHPSTLTSMNNLAATLIRQGDLQAARKLQRRLLEASWRTLGEDHPDTLTAMGGLASTLFDQGDLQGASELQRRVLDAHRRAFGQDHPRTLSSMNNLATTLHALGDREESRELQERVLEECERTLGEDHPDTLTSMSNLAGMVKAQGDWQKATELEERVLEARRRTLGEDHPDTLTSMSSRADTLYELGDLHGARELQERVLEARRRKLGEEHPDTLASMNNLAGTIRDQGDLKRARELQEQVLEAARRRLGEEHPGTLFAISNLASTVKAQGDLKRARELQERVLEAARRTLGEEHPNTLILIDNLAETLRAQGDFKRARELQRRVLEATQRTLGKEHPDTLTSMNNLADTLYTQGDLDGAQELQEQVLEAARRTLGEEHPNTLILIDNLAETLRAQGDLKRARELQEEVLEALRRTLGEEHPATLISTGNLASTLYAQGDLDGAQELQEQVLEAARRTLGEEHPNTLTLMDNLAATLRAQGDLQGARELQEQVLEARLRLGAMPQRPIP